MRRRRGGESGGFEACLPPMVDVAVGLAIIAFLYAFSESLALGRIDVYRAREERKDALEQTLRRKFKAQFDSGRMAVGGEENVQRFIFKEDVLFYTNKAGTAGLVPGALGILRKFGAALVEEQHLFAQVIVEGHTDERDIHTKEFPSNWELSAARATTLVHIFTDYRFGVGLDPAKVYAAAYGEYRPAADERAQDHPEWSETVKERRIYSKDRRVEVAVYYSIEAIRKAMHQPAGP